MVGASTILGGVAGAVIMVGFVDGAALGVEGAASAPASLSMATRGRVSVESVSLVAVKLLRLRLFPPKRPPRPPPPLPPIAELCDSDSPAAFFLGNVKAFLKLSTGDCFRSTGS